MCNVQHIVTNHTEIQISQERRAALPSHLTGGWLYMCTLKKNALLTHILSTLFSSTSVLFSCTPFGTKSPAHPTCECSVVYLLCQQGRFISNILHQTQSSLYLISHLLQAKTFQLIRSNTMNSITHTHVHFASNDIIQFQIHLILYKKPLERACSKTRWIFIRVHQWNTFSHYCPVFVISWSQTIPVHLQYIPWLTPKRSCNRSVLQNSAHRYAPPLPHQMKSVHKLWAS